ncbi:MAG: DUF432 domain-containing protein [Candidatus Nezhaarchaeota archaeon]|nr:DUF432 domain-containing protein [Candidatus Nezhaarchaeota archaeon]
MQQLIYGLSLSPQVLFKLREEGITLKIDNQGSFVLYQREGGFPVSSVRKVVTKARCREEDFLVYPVHSIQPEISTNLLLRLSRPIIVAPRSTISVYVKVPISVGIYLFDEGAQMLIDSFSRHTYKYALYGSTASGMICRFHRTDVYLQVPEKELWNAITKVIIENDSEDYCEVKNIVFPVLNTMTYVDERGAAYIEAIRLHISRGGLGFTSLENAPPLDGLKEGPRQFGKSQERVVKFLLEFGF